MEIDTTRTTDWARKGIWVNTDYDLELLGAKPGDKEAWKEIKKKYIARGPLKIIKQKKDRAFYIKIGSEGGHKNRGKTPWNKGKKLGSLYFKENRG